jgi:hypothetical protein
MLAFAASFFLSRGRGAGQLKGPTPARAILTNK